MHSDLTEKRNKSNKLFKSREENSYTRNEIMNKINEKSSLKQQINHRKSWEETRHSREIRNQSDINTGTAIFFIIKKKKLLNLHKQMNILSDHTIY